MDGLPKSTGNLAIAAAATLLAGCAALRAPAPASTGPIAAPVAWSVQLDASAASEDAAWWRGFGDPLLSRLVQQALADNPDLDAARARVRQARALLELARANLAPTLSAQASASHNAFAGAGGSELYELGVSATWEADLFGGLADARRAAEWDLLSRSEQAQAARIALAGEVGLAYVSVRALQTRLAVARDSLAAQGELAQLVDWRARAGLATDLEVEQARALREQTRASAKSLEISLAQARHALAVLVGAAPASLDEALGQPSPVPAATIARTLIPAEVLRRRPDVRAAAHAVEAEAARLDQAEAARLPQLDFTGSFGLQSASLSAGGLARSLAAGLTAPLFDAGRLRSQAQAQAAVRDQAVSAYAAAVLGALQEVEDALAAVSGAAGRVDDLTQAAAAGREAERLARQRYAAGVADFQVVLDSERTHLAVEDALASAQGEAAAARVRLYAALGGGWSVGDEDPTHAG